jgi:hypothetical protein
MAMPAREQDIGVQTSRQTKNPMHTIACPAMWDHCNTLRYIMVWCMYACMHACTYVRTYVCMYSYLCSYIPLLYYVYGVRPGDPYHWGGTLRSEDVKAPFICSPWIPHPTFTKIEKVTALGRTCFCRISENIRSPSCRSPACFRAWCYSKKIRLIWKSMWRIIPYIMYIF